MPVEADGEETRVMTSPLSAIGSCRLHAKQLTRVNLISAAAVGPVSDAHGDAVARLLLANTPTLVKQAGGWDARTTSVRSCGVAI